MCNLYTLDPALWPLVEDFQKFLGLQLVLAAGDDTLANQPRKPYVAPKGQGLFVRPIEPGNHAAGVEPAVGRWGLVPANHKGPVKAFWKNTNNCRSEGMEKSPSFRDALASRRCIIPAKAFNEWTGPEGRRTKHTISRAEGGHLFIAGLWDVHDWEGDQTESYTMIMQGTAPGEDMYPFHDRQPVFLDRHGAVTWLDHTADFSPLLTAPPSRTLAFDPPEPAAA